MKVRGPVLSMQNAEELIREGEASIQAGDGRFDFSDVVRGDSSAVAVLLRFRRSCGAKGIEFRAEHLPAGILDLCALYGVSEMLGLQS